MGFNSTAFTKDLIEGSSVTLPCPATGNPSPKRVWTKDGKPIPPGNRVFFEPDGTLEIEGARRHHHSGIFVCTLSNEYGSDSLTYTVNVMGKTLE